MENICKTTEDFCSRLLLWNLKGKILNILSIALRRIEALGICSYNNSDKRVFACGFFFSFFECYRQTYASDASINTLEDLYEDKKKWVFKS